MGTDFMCYINYEIINFVFVIILHGRCVALSMHTQYTNTFACVWLFRLIASWAVRLVSLSRLVSFGVRRVTTGISLNKRKTIK